MKRLVLAILVLCPSLSLAGGFVQQRVIVQRQRVIPQQVVVQNFRHPDGFIVQSHAVIPQQRVIVQRQPQIIVQQNVRRRGFVGALGRFLFGGNDVNVTVVR